MTQGVSQHNLIPLALAARLLYERAHGRAPPREHLSDRLNALAYRLARLGPVYAIEAGSGAHRRLSPREIAAAHFRHGAAELHFLDERAPLVHLAVTEQCIARALAVLDQAALG